MEQSQGRIWSVVQAIMIACTVLMTVIVVRREFFSPDRGAERSRPPVKVHKWDQVVAHGHVVGKKDAPVTIVEFTDFQCPFCRAFATRTYPAIKRQFGDKVSLLIRHYPLPQHPHAYAAAHAAVCAGEQNAFIAFHDSLFVNQESIGAMPFVEMARGVGIPDLRAFQECFADTGRVARIEADIQEAKRLEAGGTPTVLVDGWRIREGADSAAIAKLVSDALRRRGY